MELHNLFQDSSFIFKRTNTKIRLICQNILCFFRRVFLREARMLESFSERPRSKNLFQRGLFRRIFLRDTRYVWSFQRERTEGLQEAGCICWTCCFSGILTLATLARFWTAIYCRDDRQDRHIVRTTRHPYLTPGQHGTLLFTCIMRTSSQNSSEATKLSRTSPEVSRKADIHFR